MSCVTGSSRTTRENSTGLEGFSECDDVFTEVQGRSGTLPCLFYPSSPAMNTQRGICVRRYPDYHR